MSPNRTPFAKQSSFQIARGQNWLPNRFDHDFCNTRSNPGDRGLVLSNACSKVLDRAFKSVKMRQAKSGSLEPLDDGEHHKKERDENEELLDAVLAVELSYSWVFHIHEISIAVSQNHGMNEGWYIVDSKRQDVYSRHQESLKNQDRPSIIGTGTPRPN
jgi:hypothetical protein